MNKLKIYTLAFGLLALGSCQDDFLDTNPLTTGTETNYYKTPDEAYRALVGSYDGLHQIWGSGISFPVASEVFSDNAFGGTGNADGFGYQAIDEFNPERSPSDQNLFGDNWAAYYKAVYRANMLINKIDQVDWNGKEDLKKTYESEARFLRAFLYFDMVRLWGNIPLLTEASAENVPQANPEEVYKLLATDLQFAADNLNSQAYGAQDKATYGRVTKWAAKALLGRVYLYYTGYYGKPDLAGTVTQAQALAHLEDVITNGGFGLVGNFADLWPAAKANYAGEDNQETVFAIKYTYTSNYNGNTDGNHWLVMLGMREFAHYPYSNGWGGATVNPKLWNAYQENDTRRAASIISIADENLPFANQSKQREYTGYYNKKYTPLSNPSGQSVPVEDYNAVNFMIGQFQDYVSIRYADVLLMAAELGSPRAQQYFDQVRQRAYKSAFTPLPATKENIMAERHLEFAFEGIRYWDLLRQGVDKAAAAIAETTTVLNGGAAATKTIAAARIIETKGLQQIPNTQITLSSGVLKQNAGW
jgi:hypothetical protein